MSLATYAAPFNDDNNKSKINSKVQSKKVTNLLNKIHGTFENDDNLADFAPPPMPKSSGVERVIDREKSEPKQIPEYSEFYNTKVESFKPFNMTNYYRETKIPDDDINKKLNDIIRLLHEQQEIKTDHVTEEIILYSFFGIFIIYLVDSFKTIGKYKR